MATTAGNAALALGEVTRYTEMRYRLFFLLGALVVYRIGTFVPVPGIDPVALARLFDSQEGTILGLFNMFSGGALERLSIFAMGVMPYISASIILQMMAVVVPSMAAIKKEGESGRRKITQWTRYFTVVLAAFQGFAAAIKKEGESGRRKITQWTRYFTVVLAAFQGFAAAIAFQNQGVVIYPGTFSFVLPAVLTLTCGTMFLMWLGEQITERGIGNGISMIILSGIISGLPSAIGGTFQQVNSGEMNPAFAIILLILIGAVTAFCVFVESGQRRIPVNYAKRQVGRRMYAGQTSHLPFKLNMSGVIPPIFASSLLLFPATLASFFGTGEAGTWLQTVAAALGWGQPLHLLIYGGLIIFFCFFYTALVFNSRETAENLKKGGAFIPGIRPGQQTGEYIDKVLTRLTVWGALYVTVVCLLPEILMSYGRVPFYFGGTSLLIMVVVVMDFVAQLHAHMMSHQYEGLMKKANLRGYGKKGS